MDKSKEYAYTGIPTFCKADYGSLNDLGDYDIGVFGVPTDIAASNGFGARLGPAAIRKSSTFYNPDNYFKKETAIDLYRNQKVFEVNHPTILDLGDVIVYPTNFKKTLKTIEKFTFEVTKRAFPMILGGDHSITYPAVKGLMTALNESSLSTIGIIHFDSHPDIWDKYITQGGIWHGSPFRMLLEHGIIMGENLVQVGIRSLLADYEFNYIRDHGVRFFSISDVWQRGIGPIMKEAVTELKKKTDGVYISIDIDVFDPCFAPGTGTPEPGGMTPREMIEAISIICESCRLVGIDLVEVSPIYDPAENTQNLAAFLLHRFLIQYPGFSKKKKGK